MGVSQSLKGLRPNEPAVIPRYCIAKGPTTRPIEPSAALVAAEKHDREQERLQKEAEEVLLAQPNAEALAKSIALSESQRDKEFPPLPFRP